MLDHVLPADVDDERNLRLKCDNVREILLGAHAKICAAGLAAVRQLPEDVLSGEFVGDEVVRREASSRFGQLRDQLPERFIAKPRRQLCGRPDAAYRKAKREDDPQSLSLRG